MSGPQKEFEWLTEKEMNRVLAAKEASVRCAKILRTGTDRRFLRETGLNSITVVNARIAAVDDMMLCFIKLVLAEDLLEEQQTFEYQRQVARAIRLLEAAK